MNENLEWIEINKIVFSAANPRPQNDVEDGLDGLATSLGSQENSNLVNPPLVMRLPDDKYILIAGERRVRAAKRAGWTKMLCQVKDNLSAYQIHRLRVVENLHRKDLGPLDEAAALRVSWLSANAEALGLSEPLQKIFLDTVADQTAILHSLEDLLAKNGFLPTRPAVTWDDVLNELGIELKPENRKKLLRVLALEPEAQEVARSVGLSAAALRSIGTLAPEQQIQIAQELSENPGLARKTRRIARVVRDGKYSMDDALAEAKGEEPSNKRIFDDTGDETESGVGLFIVQLLDAVSQAQQAMDALKKILGESDSEQMSSSLIDWKFHIESASEILSNLVNDILIISIPKE